MGHSREERGETSFEALGSGRAPNFPVRERPRLGCRGHGGRIRTREEGEREVPGLPQGPTPPAWSLLPAGSNLFPGTGPWPPLPNPKEQRLLALEDRLKLV